MLKHEVWVKDHEHLHSQMVEEHKNINQLMDKFLSEVKKINGNSVSLGEILTDEIEKFNKQYDLFYCYKFKSMFIKLN